MKKLLAITLAAVLFAGLCPALAAEDTQAWDAHCAFQNMLKEKKTEIREQDGFYFISSFSYLDMDQDGVPELITRHGKESFTGGYHVEEDEALVVWRYNGAGVDRLDNYPASAQWDGDTANTLYTSIGGSGG